MIRKVEVEINGRVYEGMELTIPLDASIPGVIKLNVVDSATGEIGEVTIHCESP